MRMMRVSEVAERMSVHDETVRRWIRSGKLKSVKLGPNTNSHNRVSEEMLEQFIRSLSNE